MAEQFGLSYDDQSANDEACLKGTGQKPTFNKTHGYWQYDAVCRENKGTDLIGRELPCIFPFYYKGKRYDSCGLLETSNFVVPVWRCPVRNITTKYPGTDISHFEEDIELTGLYCIDREASLEAGCDFGSILSGTCPFRVLNPDLECDEYLKVPPFSTCKSDCPGGKYIYLQIKKIIDSHLFSLQ